MIGLIDTERKFIRASAIEFPDSTGVGLRESKCGEAVTSAQITTWAIEFESIRSPDGQ